VIREACSLGTFMGVSLRWAKRVTRKRNDGFCVSTADFRAAVVAPQSLHCSCSFSGRAGNGTIKTADALPAECTSIERSPRDVNRKTSPDGYPRRRSSVHVARGLRSMTCQLAGKASAVLLPVAGAPGKEHEQWSDWGHTAARKSAVARHEARRFAFGVTRLAPPK